MQVLITGAGGFIGRGLVASLERDGHVVYRVVRRPPAPGEVGIDLERRRVDAAHLPTGTLEGLDVVFNLAGEPIAPRRWTAKRREEILTSRVLTTDVVARALAGLDIPPAVFVSMSATGYYGSRGDELLVEGSAGGVGFLAECCRAWEAACGPARERGIRVVTARSGVVIGRGGGLVASLFPIFRHGLGGRLGTGRQWTSWISLADEVQALRFTAEHDTLAGSVNLVAPSPVRNAELTALLARLLHRPAPFAVPRAALVATVGRRLTDEFLLASQRVEPHRLEHAGFHFAHRELRPALVAALSSDSST